MTEPVRSIWKTAIAPVTRWQRHGYGPLLVVLLVWALLFLLTAAINASVEQR